MCGNAFQIFLVSGKHRVQIANKSGFTLLFGKFGDFTMRTKLIAAAALLAFASGAQAADGIAWRFTTGLDLSTGRYGGSEITDVWDVPLTVKAIDGNWTFRASTHYLLISGPANISVLDSGGGGIGDTGGGDTTGLPGTAPRRARSGFGDTTLATTYTFRNIDQSHIYVDLGARVQLPTGDDHKGLGTGATDGIGSVEVGGAWDNYGAYLSAARRFNGSSSLFTRKDQWQSSAGGWLDFDGGWETGAYYYWQSSAFNDFPGDRKVGAYVSERLAPAWRVELLGTHGFSDASADWEGELTVTYRP
jgi:hypothetical protein